MTASHWHVAVVRKPAGKEPAGWGGSASAGTMGDLIRREHPRQLARIMRARQLMGKVGAAKRDGEEEAQRRGLRAFIFGGCAPCSTCASWKRRMSFFFAVSGERPRNLANASMC